MVHKKLSIGMQKIIRMLFRWSKKTVESQILEMLVSAMQTENILRLWIMMT